MIGNMVEKVIKRDGTKQKFSEEKIKKAIHAAFWTEKLDVPVDIEENIISRVREKFAAKEEVTVESIQDLIENILMESEYKTVAKNYILYREKHKEMRLIEERVKYINDYMNSGNNAAASSETDANANVAIKNVANIDGEVYKVLNRPAQRYRMRKKLEQLYPEVAYQYEKDLESHVIYTHDEASAATVKNYCEAVTLYPIQLGGSGTMDGLRTTPPKCLGSFCGQLVNLTFLLASQCKGAVAYGEFFNFLDYYCAKDFGEDYISRSNEFVYLGPKFREILRSSGKWFPTISSLEGYDFKDERLNRLRDEIVYDSTRPATDSELRDWYEASRKGQNIPLKLGDGTRTMRAHIHQAYQQIVYGWNQPAGNRSYQSPFTNISYYDENYWHALFDTFCFEDGTKPVWDRVSWLQKDFMKWFNKERTKSLLTFPVETMALLSDGKDIIDKDYKSFTAEMYSEGHSFFTYISDNPNALASCCRLRNKIGENSFSFTTGLTGVQTGSANVITLNLNRIVQDYIRLDYQSDRLPVSFKDFMEHSSFKEYLINILERVYKYHITYKTLLYEVEEKGMLNASTAGYIKMNKLYSTVGLNGINEAAEFLGLTCSYNEDYKAFCRLITGTISEQNKLHGTKKFQFNTEFVPAEGLSSKNYNWDKADGYWVPEDRVLYNSYFYLANDPNTSVLDKFRLHGQEFTGLLDGGVGLHCNLEDRLSKEHYLKLINFAITNGTTYFTFNRINSECTNDECHYIAKEPLDRCPKCGAPMRHWTRVVGFLRPIDGFDNYREQEAEDRVYAKVEEIDGEDF